MIMGERINVSKRYFDANKVRLRPYALVTLADGSTHFEGITGRYGDAYTADGARDRCQQLCDE